MKSKGILLAVLIVAIGLVFWGKSSSKPVNGEVRIGLITDLTGPAAYWGESTRLGAELASSDLASEGYNVKFLYEDYGLEAARAASAAQKLLNVDQVDAIYSEFNPGAVVAASALKGSNVHMIYDAAITSPLSDSENIFKTYLDYQAGCKAISTKFKEAGIEKIGLLKVSLEFGDLCLAGMKEVYGDGVVVEGYNLGDTDFRTPLLKIKTAGAKAVVNVGFEGDTYNTLKVIRDLNYAMKYGTVEDTMSKKVVEDFSSILKGAWTFGFISVPADFAARVDSSSGNTKLSSYYGAALAYTHISQLVRAIGSCEKADTSCVNEKISQSPASNIIGFNGFVGRVADIDMLIKQY